MKNAIKVAPSIKKKMSEQLKVAKHDADMANGNEQGQEPDHRSSAEAKMRLTFQPTAGMSMTSPASLGEGMQFELTTSCNSTAIFRNDFDEDKGYYKLSKKQKELLFKVAGHSSSRRFFMIQEQKKV